VITSPPRAIEEVESVGIQPLRPTNRLRLGVLVSGRGSNLQALLDCVVAASLPAEIVAVASNRPSAPALGRARFAGVETASFPQSAYGDKAERDAAMCDYLVGRGVELLVLAGYDRVLAPVVLETFRNRIINIHPSLLPAFSGTLHAPAEALAHGVKVSGCTVHFVDGNLDAGPIILQRAVQVEEDDTAETLAARILVHEHQILPEAIRLIAAGRVRIDGRRCHILPSARE
jgi:phosphoribosylglycinamide formyltransferase-1